MPKKENCWFCRGSGQIVCDSCEGTGTGPKWDLSYISTIGAPIPGVKICYNCRGRGMKICPYCHGTGKKQQIEST